MTKDIQYPITSMQTPEGIPPAATSGSGPQVSLRMLRPACCAAYIQEAYLQWNNQSQSSALEVRPTMMYLLNVFLSLCAIASSHSGRRSCAGRETLCGEIRIVEESIYEAGDSFGYDNYGMDI